jgi:hypothetical protein
MTDQETVQFVHQALFRAAPADMSESINEYIADALFAAASRGPYIVPAPLGQPTARWMFSHEVKSWLSNNDTALKHDLSMFVGSQYQPVTPAKPVRRR